MTAAPDLDLRYTDDEEQLRAALRALLAATATGWRAGYGVAGTGVVTESWADGSVEAGRLWSVMTGQLGLGGLAVPDKLGGAGAGPRECAVVLEELGRAAARAPYLGSAVLATFALLSCSDEELLARLAGGEATATVVVPFSTPPASSPAALADLVRVTVDDPDGVATCLLTGAVTSVADAGEADVLLVRAGGGLYAVDAAAAGVTRTPVVSLDITRPLHDLGFDNVPGRPLATGAAADRALERALLAGAGLLASEQVGLAQWCLDTTVDYLRDRNQFGRSVGSFQALKHRLADIWVSVTQARAVARYAAGCLAELATAELASVPDGGDLRDSVAAEWLAATRTAVALAQAHCADVAVRAAEECVQLHGGIGFTWEHPAHLYLKRAKADALAFGTADQHRARLAELIDLPPAPAGQVSGR
jgi:alkylation response protein AidB-like acyl-CoA dehydrogenase